ncbi:hypothetical protein BW899_27945 [Bacillus mycoides]|nr:hypothetical protein BW899_27945 [Bacillus mycoides]
MRILRSILIVFLLLNVILVTEIFLKKIYNNCVTYSYTDSAILGTLDRALTPPFLLRALFSMTYSKYIYIDIVLLFFKKYSCDLGH